MPATKTITWIMAEGMVPFRRSFPIKLKLAPGILPNRTAKIILLTGMAETALSLMLKDLEEKDIISRKESGKTNQVFLRKKY